MTSGDNLLQGFRPILQFMSVSVSPSQTEVHSLSLSFYVGDDEALGEGECPVRSYGAGSQLDNQEKTRHKGGSGSRPDPGRGDRRWNIDFRLLHDRECSFSQVHIVLLV
uniref:Uncharacterized protein n=1 Tax=Spongospora subterranea TaxID=70186 RepID=A0A0H5RT16_9EUKA|eukprot:CRZ11874.1 hypothetical protein [Spongospora subterranea]